MKSLDFVEVLSSEEFQYLFDARELKEKFLNYATLMSSQAFSSQDSSFYEELTSKVKKKRF